MNFSICMSCNHGRGLHYGVNLNRCLGKDETGCGCFCKKFVEQGLLTDAGGELHLTAEQQFRERMLMIVATSISSGKLSEHEVDVHATRLSQIADKLGKYVLKGEC